MVSALVSGSSGPGSSPGRGHCVVFLGMTLYSHSGSLHPVGYRPRSKYKTSVIANRNQIFPIRHEGTHHEKFVQSNRMFHILT